MDDFDIGERLAQARQAAGLTQRALARRAGVPHAQVSMIESNRHSPSVATLRKVLSGVPMTMAEFFEPNREVSADFAFPQVDFLDLTSGLFHGGDATRVVMRQVGDARRHGLQILHERYEPGADTGETMLEHAAHEGGVVTRGAIELTVDGQTTTLAAGDGYLFDSRRPHRFRNTGDEPAEIISACTPPYL